jgi:glycosyltransferase involved in cell wall biosynthesis
LRSQNISVFFVRRQQANGHLPSTNIPIVSKFWSDQLWQHIKKQTAKLHYDWAIAEHCYAASYIADLTTRKILTEHNVEYRLLEQLARYNGDLELTFSLTGKPGEIFRNASQTVVPFRSFERDTWTRMDMCVAVSCEEREIMAEVVDEDVPRLHVAPNCAGIRGPRRPPGQPNIIFLGTLNYLPNVDAVVHFIQDILPSVRRRHPGVQVIIAGREPQPQLVRFCRKERVDLIANPRGLARAITTNSVMVCPLRFGAGTRIKILDAMGAGIAVVSTALAAEGLGATSKQDLIIANEAEDFASAISELLDSASLRDSITAGGLRFIDRHQLRWSAVFTELEKRLRMEL